MIIGLERLTGADRFQRIAKQIVADAVGEIENRWTARHAVHVWGLLLPRSSSHTVGKRCAAQTRSLSDVMMPICTHLTVSSLLCAPCLCRMWFSTSFFNGAAFWRQTERLWRPRRRSVQCSRATRTRRSGSRTFKLASLAIGPVGGQSEGQKRAAAVRLGDELATRCMLEPLMRAGRPGRCSMHTVSLYRACRARACRAMPCAPRMRVLSDVLWDRL